MCPKLGSLKSNALPLIHLLCVSLSTDVKAANRSRYGKPKKPVHLNYVHCTGTEQQILSCTHQEPPSLDEKKSILNQVQVAGVLCQPQSSTENPTTESRFTETESPFTENPANSSTPVDSCSQTSTASVLVPALIIPLLLIAAIGLIIL